MKQTYLNTYIKDAFEHIDFADCEPIELTPETIKELEQRALQMDDTRGLGITAISDSIILFFN